MVGVRVSGADTVFDGIFKTVAVLLELVLTSEMKQIFKQHS